MGKNQCQVLTLVPPDISVWQDIDREIQSPPTDGYHASGKEQV